MPPTRLVCHLQLSSQAFQDAFVSFGSGYKYALPPDAPDFGCTLPNGAYQVRAVAARFYRAVAPAMTQMSSEAQTLVTLRRWTPCSTVWTATRWQCGTCQQLIRCCEQLHVCSSVTDADHHIKARRRGVKAPCSLFLLTCDT